MQIGACKLAHASEILLTEEKKREKRKNKKGHKNVIRVPIGRTHSGVNSKHFKSFISGLLARLLAHLILWFVLVFKFNSFNCPVLPKSFLFSWNAEILRHLSDNICHTIIATFLWEKKNWRNQARDPKFIHKLIRLLNLIVLIRWNDPRSASRDRKHLTYITKSKYHRLLPKVGYPNDDFLQIS